MSLAIGAFCETPIKYWQSDCGTIREWLLNVLEEVPRQSLNSCQCLQNIPCARADSEILSVGSVERLGVIQMFSIENGIPNNFEFSTAQLITRSL